MTKDIKTPEEIKIDNYLRILEKCEPKPRKGQCTKGEKE